MGSISTTQLCDIIDDSRLLTNCPISRSAWRPGTHVWGPRSTASIETCVRCRRQLGRKPCSSSQNAMSGRGVGQMCLAHARLHGPCVHGAYPCLSGAATIKTPSKHALFCASQSCRLCEQCLSKIGRSRRLAGCHVHKTPPETGQSGRKAQSVRSTTHVRRLRCVSASCWCLLRFASLCSGITESSGGPGHRGCG